jgi:hypothetical protein
MSIKNQYNSTAASLVEVSLIPFHDRGPNYPLFLLIIKGGIEIIMTAIVLLICLVPVHESAFTNR